MENNLEKIKRFSTLEELFSFLNRNKINLSDGEIRELENLVITRDTTGKWCILLAEKFKEKVDIKKIEDAVIEKDRTGQFSYVLAKVIPETTREKLRKSVYSKDTTGVWKMKFDELESQGR